MARVRRAGPQRHARGFTYLGVLFIVSLLAMTAAAAGVVWATAQQRDNEVELVFAGRQFAAAIERYRALSLSLAASPSALYPPRLEALLSDDREIQPQHHLRRLYLDPMTGTPQWGLIRLPDGGIVGVHSLSDRVPYPRSIVVAGYAAPVATSYRDWRFVAPSAEVLLAPPGSTPSLAARTARAASGPAGASASPLDSPSAAPAPVVSTAPKEPAVATTARVPRPTLQDLRSQTPEACSRIAAYDEQVCAAQAERFGDDAARECRDSATARGVACSVGDQAPLAPLIVRHR